MLKTPDSATRTDANGHTNGSNGDAAPPPFQMPTTIVKRDGRIVSFEIERIANAVARCFATLEHKPRTTPDEIAHQVVNVIAAKHRLPHVEEVQDLVEMALLAAGEYEAAKRYILYRAEHAKLREARPVPEDVRAAFAASDPYFPTQLQRFQFYDKYARFNYQLGRRETWIETVDRAIAYLQELSHGRLATADYERMRQGVLNMQVMPSMRLLAMAGDAARRNNITIYNCSYMPVDSIDSFVEALIISMCGCGVGYSVERQYVERFPRVRRQRGGSLLRHVIGDSSEGWADAVRLGLEAWFNGEDVAFDFSAVRSAGAPLRTKGGRASGPEPLRRMLDFARRTILNRQGSFLRPIDAHDIMCAVGSAAVSGGVRRTAMISLFDYDDNDMLHCKSGDNLVGNEQRWNANNSAVWTRAYTQTEVADFVLGMVKSGRGEPGIFNRDAAVRTRPERRREAEFGTNPCGEIILRPFQFCNLTSAICRADDNLESLREKVELAAMLGTIQAMALHFPGLREEWRNNCREERLLGVDLNGQLDSAAAQDPQVQAALRDHAVRVNADYAQRLGINQSAAVTCVKPSGNSSTLVNSSSGIHARWAPYYIRNVRLSAHSPLLKVMRDAGAPMDAENGQTAENADTWVVHFPVRSPEGAITRNDKSAAEQCNYWLQNKLHYTEHNPSVTITYRPNEVIELIRWIWENQDKIGGMAFLPAFDAQYDQMPYVEITAEEYERLTAQFPTIDFSKVYRYEERDLTTAAQELACLAGNCDV